MRRNRANPDHRKLDRDQLSRLLDTLEWYFADLPDGLFEEEEKERKLIEGQRAALRGLGQVGGDWDERALKALASEVGEWFIGYSV